MSVTDRSLYVLQKYKVPVSTSVWKAIKLSDGMFEDGNASYYKRPSDSQDILYYIIHIQRNKLNCKLQQIYCILFYILQFWCYNNNASTITA